MTEESMLADVRPDCTSGRGQQLVVAVVYVAVMFMAIMDTTIVNVALPTIARDYHVRHG